MSGKPEPPGKHIGSRRQATTEKTRLKGLTRAEWVKRHDFCGIPFTRRENAKEENCLDLINKS